MPIDERRRSQLFARLSEAIGQEQATTMFELMPPPAVDVATRHDVDRLDDRLTSFEQRTDDRFTALEQRSDDRFTALEDRIDDRIDGLRTELLAAFRGELVTAVAGQTRAVVTATIATALSVTGSVAALAQLL